MAADVTVRLTAEGHQDILLALDQIAAKSRSTGAVAKSSFEGMGLSMSNVRNLLAQLGVAFSIGALAGFVTRTIQSTEELGRLSQGLGASIQNVSLLGYQARLLDTDVSQLSMRLTRFARTSEDAANGVGSAVHIFRDLGLSLGEIQAFKAQDTVERLAVVAEHMAKMQDGPAKTALAFQLFGRNAQAMIPLLNELATKGLAGIRKEMEDLGVMIRDQDVRALTPLHEQLRNLAIQGEALGRTFAVQVAPALTDAFAAISRQVSSSKKDMEDWGSTVRDVFKSVLLPAILIIDTIATYNRALISLIVDVNKLSGDVVTGNFTQLKTDAQTSLQAMEENFAAWKKRMSEGIGTLVHGEHPVLGPPAPAPALPGGTEDDARAQTEAIARERLTLAVAAAQQEAKQRGEIEQLAYKTAEHNADQHYATMVAIENDAWLKELGIYDAMIDEDGKIEDAKKRGIALAKDRSEVNALNARHATNLTLLGDEREMNRFTESQHAANSEMARVTETRRAIEERMTSGVLSRVEGEDAINKLLEARLPFLEVESATLMENAITPDQIEKAAEFSAKVESMRIALEGVKNPMREVTATIPDALVGALTELGSTAELTSLTVGRAFAQMALYVAQAVQKMIASIAAVKIVGLLTGLFRTPGSVNVGAASTASAPVGFDFLNLPAGHAGGGLLVGPGTGTSDSILGRFSTGEYAVKAAAVRHYGVGVMDALNSMRLGITSASPRLPRFAEGGLVGRFQSSTVSGEIGVRLAPDLAIDQMSTPAGAKVVLRHLASNPRAARRALGL